VKTISSGKKIDEDKFLSNLVPAEKLKWLMREYGNDVVRVAFSYLKNIQLAEDVSQDVFLTCFEKMDTFRNESSYKTWIIRITINKCKDVLKSWSYKNIVLTDFLSKKREQLSTENTSINNEENEFLSKLILQLPIKQREVILLYYYHDFSIEEISKMLNSNVNTVKTRLHRARNKIKTIIEGGRRNNGGG